MSRFIALASILLLLGATSCSTPCEELAEKRCACLPTTSERDACERRAADQRSKRPPSDADEDRCDALLAGCDCHQLGTREGKRACGLAE